MKFNFHYGYGTVSTLIRWASRGRVNHVSIELGDWVSEAKEGIGVQRTKKTKWDSSTVIETIEIECKDEQAVKQFLMEQVGKKYDYRGVFSFLWGFTSPKQGAWYCSELAFVALVKALGLKGKDFEEWRVSPHMFLCILKLVQSK